MKIFNAGTGKAESVARVEKTDGEWRKLLTPKQFEVTRRGGTDAPFTCGLAHAGLYQCVCCGTDLFRVASKFESGTGWPSFYEPVSKLNIEVREDRGLLMTREEVLCARCGAHLGHVFGDGPPPTGKRYCINATALKPYGRKRE